MKKIIGIILATTTSATSVLANAGPMPAPAQVVERAPNWGGFKLGAQLGYGHSSNHMNYDLHVSGFADSRFLELSRDSSSKGILGGAHVGWDYHCPTSHWLFGLEAFFEFSGLNGQVSYQDTLTQPNVFGLKSKVAMDWSVGLMARTGYAVNDTLFYLGFGWVGSKWKQKSSVNDTFIGTGDPINPQAHKDKVLNGLRLALGAGERYGRWILGVEGGYTFYAKKKHQWTYFDGLHIVTLNHKIEPRVLDAKVKVSYML